MKARMLVPGLLTLVLVAGVVPTQAGELGEFFSSIPRDYRRRHCWPEPFQYPDRMAARQPFSIMISNGWERQNLVSDFHFEPGTTQLTEGGKLRVQWIVNSCPPERRQILVHRGANVQETSQRMRMVTLYATQVAYDGNVPSIMETTRNDEGSPAEQVDTVARKAAATLPDPKLSGGSGSGSTPGGGGR